MRKLMEILKWNFKCYNRIQKRFKALAINSVIYRSLLPISFQNQFHENIYGEQFGCIRF